MRPYVSFIDLEKPIPINAYKLMNILLPPPFCQYNSLMKTTKNMLPSDRVALLYSGIQIPNNRYYTKRTSSLSLFMADIIYNLLSPNFHVTSSNQEISLKIDLQTASSVNRIEQHNFSQHVFYQGVSNFHTRNRLEKLMLKHNDQATVCTCHVIKN